MISLVRLSEINIERCLRTGRCLKTGRCLRSNSLFLMTAVNEEGVVFSHNYLEILR